jgi:type VI secretion system protein ImpA
MALPLDKLLAPLSPDKPCGEDLSYDPQYYELEQLAAGKPEQQVGDTIVPAEDPNWKEVLKLGTELLGRSKDLRIAMHVANAAARMSGVEGVRDGLALLRGLVEHHWATVHPQLDPEDNNDPALRLNVLSALAHPESYLKHLRAVPLANSALVGRFGLRDIEIASGAVPPPTSVDPNTPLPDSKLIEGAFAEMSLEALTGAARALEAAGEHAKALDGFLTTTLGAAGALNLADLHKCLATCRTHVASALARRQGDAAPVSEGDAAPAGPAGATAAGGSAVGGVPGEIRSKADVLKIIDRICEFYERNEPSSPVPLLLKRVKRLVNKNFLEIIKDLNPSALSSIEALAGIDSSQTPAS